LVTAADSDPLIDGGGAAPEVPSTLLPLFPTTSSTRPGKATTTVTATAAVAVGAPPRLGTYIYAVDGSETLKGHGSRRLPATMTMTVTRESGMSARDVTLSYTFSNQHVEREVVSFDGTAVAGRYHTFTVTFGIATRTFTATARPAVTRAALPLTAGMTRSGVSDATDGAGEPLRTEDWKVTDIALRRMTEGGKPVDVWEITVDRTSRPGASESLSETRRWWFDPTQGLAVRWESRLHIERTDSVGTTYDSTYSATLTETHPA
jgi:hypothetical protein